MQITVIVTAYNAEDFIEECVDSTLAQTRKPDQIIVALDRGTDSTLEKLKKYGESIAVIAQHENVGPLRNTLSGMLCSTGDIIAFIDGDDTWPASKLEKIEEEFIKSSNVILVSHGHERVSKHGQSLNVSDATHKNIRLIEKTSTRLNSTNQALRSSILFRRGFWLGSAYSIRSSALNLGAFCRLLDQTPLSRLAYMDLVLAPFLVQTNPQGEVKYIPELVFKYRIHDAGSGAGKSIQQQLSSISRLRATNSVAWHCLAASGGDDLLRNRHEILDREFQFLDNIYRGNAFKSFVDFAFLLRHFFDNGSLLKEFTRLGVATILGPKFFLKLKSLR
jgi:glycosyltransferase involved in cell wall biosynthesis